MYRIYQTDELDTVRALHEKLFPDDAWRGDDHTYWIVEDTSGLPVGFASAVHRPALGYVYLSLAGLDPSARGAGLQRRLIRCRVRWARKLGVREVKTYTLLKNYESFINLLKCGFRFYEPEHKYVGDSVHYLRLVIE